MGSRVELQIILENLLGSSNVYFQPPTGFQMKYPAIVYERDYAKTEYASNLPYLYAKRYEIMVIDRDPDSPIPDRVSKLPYCAFSRHFKAENLNHDVFNLYY